MDNPCYSIGEFAKKMCVSVRTLQYYDKQGLLQPSSHSEGGRRQYDSRNALRLQQILSLKYIGLSLSEIKRILSTQNNNLPLKEIVETHITLLEKQIAALQESLTVLKLVAEENETFSDASSAEIAEAIFLTRRILHKEWLDLEKFDPHLQSHITNKGASNEKFPLSLARQFEKISQRMYTLVQENADPTGAEGQKTARALWEMIEEFTGGDMSLLPHLVAFNENKSSEPKDMRQQQEAIDDFMGKALSFFLETQAITLE